MVTTALNSNGVYAGVRTVRRSKSIRSKVEVVRGYYFVLPNDERHWFGETFDKAMNAFEETAGRLLTDEAYSYWIDYCFGHDVYGKLAWQDLDLSDRFMDELDAWCA